MKKSKSIFALVVVFLVLVLGYVAFSSVNVGNQGAAVVSRPSADLIVSSLKWSNTASGPFANGPLAQNLPIYFRVGITNVGGRPIVLPAGYTLTASSYATPQGYAIGTFTTTSAYTLNKSEVRYYTIQAPFDPLFTNGGGFNGGVYTQSLPDEGNMLNNVKNFMVLIP